MLAENTKPFTKEQEEFIDKVMEENKDLMNDLAGTAPTPSTPEEVLDTRTAAEQEAAMLKQAQDDAEAFAQNRDPSEIAALAFHMFFPKFQNATLFLSNKELRRLVLALIGKGHQSMPDHPTFKDRRTGEAYKMGLELLSAKFMMITKLEMDALQKNVDDQEAEAKTVADNAVIETQYGAEASEENNNVTT